jgi:hypothetical protein
LSRASPGHGGEQEQHGVGAEIEQHGVVGGCQQGASGGGGLRWPSCRMLRHHASFMAGSDLVAFDRKLGA